MTLSGHRRQAIVGGRREARGWFDLSLPRRPRCPRAALGVGVVGLRVLLVSGAEVTPVATAPSRRPCAEMMILCRRRTVSRLERFIRAIRTMPETVCISGTASLTPTRPECR